MAAASKAQADADLKQSVIARLGWTDTVMQAATNKRRTRTPDYERFADAASKTRATALANPSERFRHATAILGAKGSRVALGRGSSALGESEPSSQILCYLNAVDRLSDGRIRLQS